MTAFLQYPVIVQPLASAFSASRPMLLVNLLRHRARANTKRGAKKNIVAHTTSATISTRNGSIAA